MDRVGLGRATSEARPLDQYAQLVRETLHINGPLDLVELVNMTHLPASAIRIALAKLEQDEIVEQLDEKGPCGPVFQTRMSSLKDLSLKDLLSR